MKRSVQVRVRNSGGQPISSVRVGIEVHQFAAGGFMPNEHTDSSGEAVFNLDTDTSAEITIYVDGQPKTKRGYIEGQYTIYL